VTRFAVRGGRIVLPDGERDASVYIEDGRIVRVARSRDVPSGVEIIEAGDLIVSPGIVDSHVHVNEPGRTEWEGFDTATRAAAAGGVTTIVDMPLNSIPATINRRALEAKRTAADGRCHVDVAFWGGIVPGNADSIAELADAGVRGFKCFLTPSGVDEFPCVTERDLRRVLPVLARVSSSGRLLLVHAEDPARLTTPSGDPRRYYSFAVTRPVEAEVDAIRLMAALAAEYHVSTHIVHVSSGEGLSTIAEARAQGIPISAETCPHYLTFAADDIPEGATAFKCAPPVREARHREALWAGLRDGTCEMVVSDHSPAPPSTKCVDHGDFVEAWGGIASIELSFPATWTGAVRRGFDRQAIARWMSERPARLCGLEPRKGGLREGCDADFVIWDPDAEFDVVPAVLQQRHKLTPYAGRRLRGVVRSTYVRGIRVWHDGNSENEYQGRLI